LGLLYGGTIGAATGAAVVAGWLGWSTLMNLPETVTTDRLEIAEALISVAVARTLVVGCLGGVVGAVIGSASGWLAAIVRPRLRRYLTALTTLVSALAAAACVLPVWYASNPPGVPQDSPPSAVMLVMAIAAGAIGGITLGNTLSARANAPFSSTDQGIQ
jgi:hypothetical protein